MSVAILGRVFFTEFKDLSFTGKNEKKVNVASSTAKLVMLSIADSADDFGENSYQSFETIATKASIERRSVIRVVKALIDNGYLSGNGMSKYGTNNFSVNLEKLGQLPAKRSKNGRPKTSDSEVKTSDSEVKTSDPQSPDPSSTRPDPSFNSGEPKPLKASQIPEVVLFREVTRRYPPSVNNDDVVSSVKAMEKRLGHPVTADELLPFYKAWCRKGYKPVNLAWLEWAETGVIPENGTWKSQKFSTDGLVQYFGGQNGR